VGHEAALIAGIERALTTHRDQVLRVLADLGSRPPRLGLGPLTAVLEAPGQVAGKAEVEAALDRIGAALAADVAPPGGHPDVAALVRALRDPIALVRVAAARALRDLRAAGATAALIGAARPAREPIGEVRRAAVEALRAIGGPEATAALRAIAAGDPDPTVR